MKRAIATALLLTLTGCDVAKLLSTQGPNTTVQDNSPVTVFTSIYYETGELVSEPFYVTKKGTKKPAELMVKGVNNWIPVTLTVNLKSSDPGVPGGVLSFKNHRAIEGDIDDPIPVVYHYHTGKVTIDKDPTELFVEVEPTIFRGVILDVALVFDRSTGTPNGGMGDSEND